MSAAGSPPGVLIPPHRCKAVSQALRAAIGRLESVDRVPAADWVWDLVRDLDRAGSAQVPAVDVAPVPPDNEATMTVNDVADRAGVTPRAVRKAIATGRLPARQMRGRWLIAADDADRYTPRTRR